MASLIEIQSDLQFLPIFVILGIFILFWSYCNPGSFSEHDKKHKSSIPTNWPFFGMLPSVLRNSHRLLDYGTDILNESGGTFEIKGPWLANVNKVVLTSDPANVRYILNKNLSNYPKGPNFRKMFDILGQGISSSDGELWEIHRKVTLSLMHHPDYKRLFQETVLNKVERALLPILGNFAESGVEIDMQDILDRFRFDVSSKFILDDDPGSLSEGFPKIPCQWGFKDAEQATVQRHVLPEICWNLQKRLNFGRERKMAMAWEVIDRYIYHCIEKKPELFTTTDHVEPRFSSMSAILQAYKNTSNSNSSCPPITKKFLRDVLFNLLSAGKDTITTGLAWFFFLVAKNPSVEAKILQEIENNVTPFQPWHRIISNMGEYSQKLVYLHGAVCETLRLFPPLAVQHRAPSEPDILPSGVRISRKTDLVMSFYSMGRME